MNTHRLQSKRPHPHTDETAPPPPSKTICGGLGALTKPHVTDQKVEGSHCNTTIISAKEKAVAHCHALGKPDRIRQLIEDYQTWLAPQQLSITDQDTDTGIVRAIVRTYATHKKRHPDTPPLDLSGLNLSGMMLKGLPLSHANLSHSNLSGATLTHSDFSGATLTHCDFSRANLSLSDLSGANLSHSDFSGANLAVANLNTSILTFTNLRKANLRAATLKESQLWHTNLEGSHLCHADLSEATVTSSDFTNANLSMCKCDRVIWYYQNLKHAHIHIEDFAKWDAKTIQQKDMVIDCDQNQHYDRVASVTLEGKCVTTRLLKELIRGNHPSLAKVKWAIKISLNHNKEVTPILETLKAKQVAIPIEVMGYQEDTLQNRSLAVVLGQLLKSPHHYHFLQEERKSKLEAVVPELMGYLAFWASKPQPSITPCHE